MIEEKDKEKFAELLLKLETGLNSYFSNRSTYKTYWERLRDRYTIESFEVIINDLLDRFEPRFKGDFPAIALFRKKHIPRQEYNTK